MPTIRRCELKKILIGLLFILLTFVSCKRDEVVEPPISGPSTLSYILEGSANPTTVIVSFERNSTQITVRLYDFTGKPIVGAPIFFETLWTYTLVKQTYDQYGTLTKEEAETGGGRADLGNFYGHYVYQAYTDANGYVNITYNAPDFYEYCDKTLWYYGWYGPPDNPLIDKYILHIDSFYIRARWVSPPNSNMTVYCDIPVNLEVSFKWPCDCP